MVALAACLIDLWCLRDILVLYFLWVGWFTMAPTWCLFGILYYCLPACGFSMGWLG